MAVSNCENPAAAGPDAPGVSNIPKTRATAAKVDQSQWPKGKRQKLTKILATRIFSALSTCEGSVLGLLRAHPEFPPYRDMLKWRKNHSWFKSAWQDAREAQGEFLAQLILDIQANATKETAHLCRVRIDALKLIAGKLNPAVWGERPPADAPVQTVNVGIAISPERLADLRSRLDSTRASFFGSRPTTKDKHNGTNDSPKHLLP